MFYLNKDYRTSHWVGISKPKELDTIGFFEIKQMIENMESEQTESSEINSKTDNLAITEEAASDLLVRWVARTHLTKRSEERRVVLNPPD